MGKRAAFGLTAALVLSALMLGAAADSDRQLTAAMHREMVAGDLQGAILLYRGILAQHDTPRQVAARALMQIGRCQEKLGQRPQAYDTYTRVARDFEAEAAIAGEARTRLANWGPRNLRFAEGDVGETPPGWTAMVLEKSTGKIAELRRRGCRSGIGCAVLIAPATAPGLIGNLMQSFSAAAYRGKTVRLRAWLRVEAGAPGDRANMSLGEDRPNGQPGFFADMDERAVRSPEWTSCEIIGKIHPDAQFLRFGFQSIGHGRVWIDSVSFEVVNGATN